jgi:hypothetical protein
MKSYYPAGAGSAVPGIAALTEAIKLVPGPVDDAAVKKSFLN